MGIVKIILFIFMDYKHAMITHGTHEQIANSSKCLCLSEEGKHVFNQCFLTGVYFYVTLWSCWSITTYKRESAIIIV